MAAAAEEVAAEDASLEVRGELQPMAAIHGDHGANAWQQSDCQNAAPSSSRRSARQDPRSAATAPACRSGPVCSTTSSHSSVGRCRRVLLSGAGDDMACEDPMQPSLLVMKMCSSSESESSSSTTGARMAVLEGERRMRVRKE